MRTSRAGYLMAMMAGVAIVGASTGGAVLATHHHDQTVAAAAADVASVTASEADTASSAPATNASPTATAAVVPTSAAVPTSSPAAVLPAESTAATTTPASSTTALGRSSTTSSATSQVQSSTAQRVSVTTVTPTVTSSTPAAHQFKDGKYSAVGSYNSPGGIEKLGVTVTLVSDKVTTSALDLLGGAGLSHTFQTAFAGGYASQVIGKDISTIKLGAVSGSSLTGIGFNAAITQIESEARTGQ